VCGQHLEAIRSAFAHNPTLLTAWHKLNDVEHFFVNLLLAKGYMLSKASDLKGIQSMDELKGEVAEAVHHLWVHRQVGTRERVPG
jgi:hypothetical protein